MTEKDQLFFISAMNLMGILSAGRAAQDSKATLFIPPEIAAEKAVLYARALIAVLKNTAPEEKPV